MVVISDKKISQGNGSYHAELIDVNDYYAFGGLQDLVKDENLVLSKSYLYGFNGKENDNEVKGEGNQQDYGMRIYDPRLGKFLSVDPLKKSYPFYTAYSFAGNKPIECIDLDGEEESIPYSQSNAFALMPTSTQGVSYVRGKKGDRLGAILPERGKSGIDRFQESIFPMRISPHPNHLLI